MTLRSRSGAGFLKSRGSDLQTFVGGAISRDQHTNPQLNERPDTCPDIRRA